MSGRSQRSTIQCPGCNRILPGYARQCQHCGSQLGGYDYEDRSGRSQQEGLAAVAACLVLLQGMVGMLVGFEVFQTEVDVFGGMLILGVLGVIRTLFGLGMLLRQTWATMILQWICIAGLFWDGCGFVVGLFAAADSKDGSWLLVLLEMLSLGICGFAVYVIHNEETSR